MSHPVVTAAASTHLPALQIVIPLISAPLCLLVRNRRLAWFVAMLASASALLISILLLRHVHDHGVISYALGGWAAPFGIEYRVDYLSAFVLLLVSALGSIVCAYSPASVDSEIPADKHYLFYCAYMLCMTGLLGIVVTGDVFNVFVFLEVASLSAYILISLGKSRQALTAAYQYLVMGTVGSTFILIGIGFLYMMTGTLNMVDLADKLGPVLATRQVLVAFAFFTVGVSIKMALFPLHLWLPNAYTNAPSVVTAFLAATATKVAVYILIRFVFTIFGVQFAFDSTPVAAALMPLSLIGILVASGAAIFQKSVKRMLAYSSVAQIGYMVLGISFVSVSGLTGGIVHLFNHALMKGGLFLAVGCVALRMGSTTLDDFRGIGYRMPVTMFAFVLGGLSMIGVPLTVGFISKWYLILAALEKGWWPVVVLILFSSLLAVVYIWRVVEVAYFQKPADESPVREAPLSMLVPMCILIAASIYFGVQTEMTVGIARQAAELLMGGGAP